MIWAREGRGCARVWARCSSGHAVVIGAEAGSASGERASRPGFPARPDTLASLLAAALLLALAASGCSAVEPTYGPPYEATGLASWYGPGYEGRLTASGEVFDAAGLTAAHQTLRFGAVLRVTHLGNGREVEVRVNDRGPFVEGRILDLSQGAAEILGMIDEGVALVAIVEVR